jgi:hypothetical protein
VASRVPSAAAGEQTSSDDRRPNADVMRGLHDEVRASDKRKGISCQSAPNRLAMTSGDRQVLATAEQSTAVGLSTQLEQRRGAR